MTIPQDEPAVRAAYDEVADTYADHFRSTEPELPVELAMLEHFASQLPGERPVLDDLPFPGGSFDGVFSWYSTIHAPHAALPRVLDEVRRVLRPGGLVLVAFQAGRGQRDVSDNHRRRGHEIVLQRFNRTPEEVARALAAAGLTEVARLQRAAAAHEKDAQAVLIARGE